MNPSNVREVLLGQHERLRSLFAHAVELARGRDAGAERTEALAELLHEIAAAFSQHNQYEESVLRPMLLAQDGWGPARVERMMDEHAGEHRAFVAHLADEAIHTVAGLAAFVEEVEAHMAAEERVFINVAVLR